MSGEFLDKFTPEDVRSTGDVGIFKGYVQERRIVDENRARENEDSALRMEKCRELEDETGEMWYFWDELVLADSELSTTLDDLVDHTDEVSVEDQLKDWMGRFVKNPFRTVRGTVTPGLFKIGQGILSFGERLGVRFRERDVDLLPDEESDPPVILLKSAIREYYLREDFKSEDIKYKLVRGHEVEGGVNYMGYVSFGESFETEG